MLFAFPSPGESVAKPLLNYFGFQLFILLVLISFQIEEALTSFELVLNCFYHCWFKFQCFMLLVVNLCNF
jgi:hypothetical protein